MIMNRIGIMMIIIISYYYYYYQYYVIIMNVIFNYIKFVIEFINTSELLLLLSLCFDLL